VAFTGAILARKGADLEGKGGRAKDKECKKPSEMHRG